MARCGFDWLVVDSEHTAVNIETVAQMMIAMASAPVAPMVRIPWLNGENIKRVLDAGAWGIVVPQVTTMQEAEDAVRWTKYPPIGERSVGGGRCTASFDTTKDEYVARANDEILVVVQIEHIKAVENADEILAVPGIDACFIGPNDLSASLGLKPEMEPKDPSYTAAVRHVLETAKKQGVAPGIHVRSAEAANRRIAEGFQFIALSSDLNLMLAAAQSELGSVLAR
jgi:4-hydroxy-2-oxoheptanedioate aldolase